MDRRLRFRLFLLAITSIALVLAIVYRDADLSSLKKFFDGLKSSKKSTPSSPPSDVVTDAVSFKGMSGKVLLEDYFADNHNKWYETDDDKAKFKIADSAYAMKYYGSKSYLAWLACTYDDKDTIGIEADIEVVGGASSHGFGLMWNAQNASNTNYFTINQDGGYVIGKYDADEGSSRMLEGDVQVTDTVNPKRYRFEIRKAGGTLDAYINDHAVVSGLSLGRYFGGGVGFILVQDKDVRARRIRVVKYSR